MRHRKFGKKLNRNGSHRKALLRNMSAALYTHGRIITTRAKAKFLVPYAERIMTLARKGGLFNYRRAITALGGEKAVAKVLFEKIAPFFADRPGGYLRILNYAKAPRRESSRDYFVTVNRLGDNAPLALVELVGYSEGAFGELFAKTAAGDKDEESTEG